MADPRYSKLADLLINYSCAVEPGDKVLIDSIDAPQTMVRALIRAVADAGGVPLAVLHSKAVWRDLMLCGSEEQMTILGETERELMTRVQAYVAIRADPNISEWSDVPPDKGQLYRRFAYAPVHLEVRVPHTRWVILRWPNDSMAQEARMPTEAFESFYFDVCTMDYARMSRAMQPLRDLLEATDRVRLKAPGTDLTFSVQGIPAVCCDGRNNIPDGEVFTAPVKDSVEGTIHFNTPTIYEGTSHDDVRFVFRQGRIVEASSSDTASLEAVLGTDDGARYVGEFAVAFNPYITTPMMDILFDEKIAGSVHLAVGNAYDDAWNGNKSDVHWDLVLRMEPEQGGGEVWFDDSLVRKDGRFVIPELEGLNPERLKG